MPRQGRKALGQVKGSTLNAQYGSYSSLSSEAPSILKPISRGKSQGTKGTKAAKGFNSTLSHQPLGQSDWLRGNVLNLNNNDSTHHDVVDIGGSDATTTATVYEVWREDTQRDRRKSEDHHKLELFEEEEEEEEEEARFAPEEVDYLVSIISEKENELTVSTSESELVSEFESECEDKGEEELFGDEAEHQHLEENQARTLARETYHASSHAVESCALSSANQSEAEVEEDRDREETSTVPFSASDCSHMVVVDRVVRLELEKERATRKLKDWATCANELQQLYEQKTDECKSKDATSSQLTRELEKKKEELGEMAKSVRESEELVKHLRQELVLKEQLVKESKENCKKLRTALMDAELELDRKEKLLTSSGRDTNGQALELPKGSGSQCQSLSSLRAELSRKAEQMLEKDKKIMKQDFEIQKSRVQMHQQKQQIQMLTQELSRLRNRNTTSKGGDEEHEKGELLEELALQIEEGSREIKIIQQDLLAANPTLFN